MKKQQHTGRLFQTALGMVLAKIKIQVDTKRDSLIRVP